MADINVKAGSTQAMIFQLKSETSPGVFTVTNLTGLSVEIRIRFDNGLTANYNTITHPTKIAITDASNGKVAFYPETTTFTLPVKSADIFFWVTDADARKIPYPSEGSIRIRVEQNW